MTQTAKQALIDWGMLKQRILTTIEGQRILASREGENSPAMDTPQGASPHQPGHDCAECHVLDAPMGDSFTLRDLIFQAIYAELSGDSILHYLIQRRAGLIGQGPGEVTFTHSRPLATGGVVSPSVTLRMGERPSH